MKRSMARGMAVVVVALGLVAAASAQPPAQPEVQAGDTLGTYLVRPGDTLQGITEAYLGTPALWPENWRLNPWIEDPDLLLPGQRLRVIVERLLPPSTAQVRKVAREVDQKPHPYAWQAAHVGDLLGERDGVRTGGGSSAELLLGDREASRLTIAEKSVVFLAELSSRITGGSRQSVEIVEGQADLQAAPARPDRVEIEILVGDARAEPRPGADGRAEARARARDGGAELMLYAGEGDVEAGGERVRLEAGTGTRVERGMAPTAPERLLPAPRLIAPGAGAERSWSNPVLAWDAVPGASVYVVEVCRDSACGEVVARQTGVAGDRWTPPSLPVGELVWRVTAVAGSGLDGFPAAPRALTVTGSAADLEPPAIVVTLRGAARAVGPAEVRLGDGGTLMPAAADDASGVAEIRVRWDEGSWRVWDGSPLRPPSAGSHRLELAATDRHGRESGGLSVVVSAGGAPPEPPSWPSGDPGERGPG